MRAATFREHHDLGDGLASFVEVTADHDRHPLVFFAVYRKEVVHEGSLGYTLARWEIGGMGSPSPDDALTYKGRPTKGRRRGAVRSTEEVRAMFAELVERFRARVVEPRATEEARAQRAREVLAAVAGD